MDYKYSKKPTINRKPNLAQLKLKICGMNLNTSEVAILKPDYLGFIFWKPSKRFFEGKMPSIPHSIKKVGVFVNANMEEITEKVKTFDLIAVQLHGNETASFCDALKAKLPHLKIIKVFTIQNDFDFVELTHFEDLCDYYLFDTKGKLPGGNGYLFNWQVLKKYPSTKPYFLSGGVGLDELENLKKFMAQPESLYCHAVDINSRFEIEPGLKNIEKLKKFKTALHADQQ